MRICNIIIPHISDLISRYAPEVGDLSRIAGSLYPLPPVCYSDLLLNHFFFQHCCTCSGGARMIQIIQISEWIILIRIILSRMQEICVSCWRQICVVVCISMREDEGPSILYDCSVFIQLGNPSRIVRRKPTDLLLSSILIASWYVNFSFRISNFFDRFLSVFVIVTKGSHHLPPNNVCHLKPSRKWLTESVDGDDFNVLSMRLWRVTSLTLNSSCQSIIY